MEKKAASLLHLLTGNILSPIKTALFFQGTLSRSLPCNYWTGCFTEVASVMRVGCFLGTTIQGLLREYIGTVKAHLASCLNLTFLKHFLPHGRAIQWSRALLAVAPLAPSQRPTTSPQYLYFVGYDCLITVAVVEKSHSCKQTNSRPVNSEDTRRT